MILKLCEQALTLRDANSNTPSNNSTNISNINTNLTRAMIVMMMGNKTKVILIVIKIFGRHYHYHHFSYIIITKAIEFTQKVVTSVSFLSLSSLQYFDNSKTLNNYTNNYDDISTNPNARTCADTNNGFNIKSNFFIDIFFYARYYYYYHD